MQPTTRCNLNCSYCYIPEDARRRSSTMIFEVLDATLTRLVEEDLLERELTISWHGAEPLMAGIDWYREAFARVTAKLDSRRVDHVFQTNGVLLDDAWCDLI